MARPFFVMELDKYGQIINDALNVAEAGEDASPTGLEVLDNFLYPNLQQRKEFGQQVALTKMQQDFAVSGKMAAAKEVGINPHTMAAGIAGASSPAAGSPNSAIGQGAASLGAASQAVQSAIGAADTVGSLYEKFTMTPQNEANSIADTYLKYKQAGYEDQAAMGLAIANQYLPAEKMLGIVRLSQDIKNLRQEYNVMVQTVEESKARSENLTEQINLYKAQGREADAKALEAQRSAELLFQQTTEAQWLNDKRKQYNIDPRSPIENNIFMLGIENDPRYEDSLNIVYDTQYTSHKGANQAEIEDGYNKALASLKADKDLQSLYAPYFAMIEANKSAVIEFIKMVTENPKDIRAIIGKLTNLMGQFGLAGYLDKNAVNNAKRPVAGDPFKSE